MVEILKYPLFNTDPAEAKFDQYFPGDLIQSQAVISTEFQNLPAIPNRLLIVLLYFVLQNLDVVHKQHCHEEAKACRREWHPVSTHPPQGCFAVAIQVDWILSREKLGEIFGKTHYAPGKTIYIIEYTLTFPDTKKDSEILNLVNLTKLSEARINSCRCSCTRTRRIS